MRKIIGFVGFFGFIGCSDYEVLKRSSDAASVEEVTEDSAAPEPTVPPPVDTGEPEDTGDEGLVEDPPEDTAPPVDTGEDPPEDPPVEVPVEPVYVHSSSTLYSLDPTTGTLGLVGDFYEETDVGIAPSITDIAIDSDGNFFGISFSALYGVDPTDARIWYIAPLESSFVGLTATSDGRLIGAGDGLYVIDPVTGGATPLVEAGFYETSGDVVGLPSSLLYWLVRGDDTLSGDLLVEVDATTGVNRVVGSVGVSDLFGVGYAGGSLYGFSESGLMVEIDPMSAVVTRELALSGSWWGAATNPVVWETVD